MAEPLIIVGKGMAATRLVDELSQRALGRYSIAVIGAESRLAYNRVLLSPLLAGEILVARATDPGWTPLFVNAAAILLEVGGLLQHGALVAREYGKPCVAGVENATERFTDGEWVEVDGSAGIIRKIVNSEP